MIGLYLSLTDAVKSHLKQLEIISIVIYLFETGQLICEVLFWVEKQRNHIKKKNNNLIIS